MNHCTSWNRTSDLSIIREVDGTPLASVAGYGAPIEYDVGLPVPTLSQLCPNSVPFFFFFFFFKKKKYSVPTLSLLCPNNSGPSSTSR